MVIDLINVVLSYRPEHIETMPLNGVNIVLQAIADIKEGSQRVWTLFQGFDTDQSPSRTLELIRSHANGTSLASFNQFTKNIAELAQRLHSPAPSVNKEEQEYIEKLQKFAQCYLEYQKQKDTLETQEKLLNQRKMTLTQANSASSATNDNHSYNNEQFFKAHPPASGLPTMRFMQSNQLAHDTPPTKRNFLHQLFKLEPAKEEKKYCCLFTYQY